jgi:hypothetical protein
MNKTGIVICSYNMPEAVEHIVSTINYKVHRPYDLVVVDNGSDLVSPSVFTTDFIPVNIQMVPGFMEGMRILDKKKEDYFAYWLITTSVSFLWEEVADPLDELLKILESDESIYAVQPSFIFENGGSWEQYLTPREPFKPRRIWGLEYSCPLFRASHFNRLGRWNEELTYGWGIASETGYLARKEGLKFYTDDAHPMRKNTQIGYVMERMNMSAVERGELASKQCKDILEPKYNINDYTRLNVMNRALGENGEY